MSLRIACVNFIILYTISLSKTGRGLYVEKTYFPGNIFRIFKGIGPRACAIECLRRHYCASANYNTNLLRCELNTENGATTLQSHVQFAYQSRDNLRLAIDDPCRGTVCPTDETCITLKSGGVECVKTECIGLPVVPNAEPIFTTNRKIGVTLPFTCKPSYSTTGSTIKCKTSGVWSVPPPCIADCGQPANVQHASLQVTTTTLNSMATYTCATGYLTIGSGNGSIFCQEVPTIGWTTLSISCIQNCGTPPSMANSVVTTSGSAPGSTASYTCIAGYTMNGVSQPLVISCSASSVWDDLLNFCVLDCGSPPSLSNGYVLAGDTYYLSQRSYNCNSGYTASHTSRTITCQNTGLWSSIYFSCTDCGTPPSMANSVVTTSGSAPGSTASYTCNAGYTMNGVSQPLVISCSASSVWDDLLNFCVLDCGSPPSLSNGYVLTGDTYYLSQRSYNCNSGYTASHTSRTITCQNTGLWSSIYFSCTVVCPTGWRENQATSICFQVNYDKTNWATAEANCITNQAHLIKLGSTAIRNVITNRLYYDDEDYEVWTGGKTDETYVGNAPWYWISDNSTVLASLWKSDHPKGVDKKCALLDYNELKALECHHNRAYVCAIEM